MTNMTMGNIVFCSGVGLLVFTIVLGIIFWIKKPQYIPGSAAYDGTANQHTQKLRSGYPTDRLTIRRESKQPAAPGAIMLQEVTERLAAEQTEPLPDTAVLPGTAVLTAQQTEKLSSRTVSQSEETAPLLQAVETVPLCDSTDASGGEIMLLNPSEQPGDTEKTSGTAPLSGV